MIKIIGGITGSDFSAIVIGIFDSTGILFGSDEEKQAAFQMAENMVVEITDRVGFIKESKCGYFGIMLIKKCNFDCFEIFN